VQSGKSTFWQWRPRPQADEEKLGTVYAAFLKQLDQLKVSQI
jgi:hypothetical protein